MKKNRVLWFWVKKGQNGPKIRFFMFYEKVAPRIFLIFLHKVTVAYELKIVLKVFWVGKSCFEIFGPKGASNWVLSNVSVWNLFFPCSYSRIKT